MPENLPAIQTNAEVTQLSPLAGDFAILNPKAAAEIRAINQANLGQRGLVERELDRIKVPTGGATSFVAQGIDGEEHLRQVDFICLDWSDRRMYYRIPFDQRGKQKGTPPDCASRDGFIGVGDPGGQCHECPLSDWGSDPKGGRGQACKEMRQLLILRTGIILPELINIPPTSLKNARDYFKRLSGRQVPFWSLVTTLRLERVDNADGVPYARVIFTAGPRLNEAEREALTPFQEQMSQVLRNMTVEAEYEVVPDQDFSGGPRPSRDFASPTDD